MMPVPADEMEWFSFAGLWPCCSSDRARESEFGGWPAWAIYSYRQNSLSPGVEHSPAWLQALMILSGMCSAFLDVLLLPFPLFLSSRSCCVDLVVATSVSGELVHFDLNL